MTIKQKILSRIGIMIITAAVLVMVIVMVNFRAYGIKAATEKAEVVSELVKNGLTSHMQNGTMDKRDTFLSNLSHIKDVEKLWVIRGEVVNRQYGPPRKHEVPRDKIDKEVLASGEKKVLLSEKLDSAVLRVTIPYIASADELINCFACHDANHGDTLGAISMEFDIMSIRESGIDTIVNILVVTTIAIMLVIFLTNRSLNPYLELFESLKRSIKQAAAGDFSGKVESSLTDEAGEMVQAYDTLLEKLERTFGKIDRNLRKFVATKNCSRADPLSDAEHTITSLTHLYHFKKAIELDVTKEDIYNRLQYVLENYYGAKNFSIIEINPQTGESEVVADNSDYILCAQCTDADPDVCRAKRTGIDVVSDEFPELCDCFREKDEHHICIPINVSGKIGLVIHIVSYSTEEFDQIKQQVGFIKNYANEASPVIETKRLMKMLRDSSLKDALTGLYNRRFLDEYVEKLKAQMLRQKRSIGLMLIDMDHFKMVNDSYGHDVGDIVLKELAQTLEHSIRESDLAIRYGGEEFIVILMDVDSEEKTMQIAEKIRRKIEEKSINIGDNKQLSKTISIGVSIFSKDSNSLWQAIKYADIALYKAKMTGRNRVVRFDRSMSDDTQNF